MTKHSVYEQHHDWATLGFIRAIASSRTMCQSLIDRRWLHTLLNIISIPAAAAVSADDQDNDGHSDASRPCLCSLPKRVGDYLLENLVLF